MRIISGAAIEGLRIRDTARGWAIADALPVRTRGSPGSGSGGANNCFAEKVSFAAGNFAICNLEGPGALDLNLPDPHPTAQARAADRPE